ncbi:MAG: phosphoribosyltransferase family protein [Acidobacteriota bacterium]
MRLHAPGPGLCGCCARPIFGLIPDGFLCGACRSRPPAYDGLVAAFAYEPPLDAVIGALKFRRLEYLGEELAAALLHTLSHSLAAQESLTNLADLVVPVPLHWRRRLERGFNQAERIARPLAAALDCPLVSALRRRRHTRAQARLERGERVRNPLGAFALGAAQRLRGARVLLVDDVVTTAATVEAAARILKAAGAERVLVAAVARTLVRT